MSLKEKIHDRVHEKKEKIHDKLKERKQKTKERINHMLNIPKRVQNLKDLRSLSQEELDFCFNAHKFNEIEDDMDTGDILLFSGLESKKKSQNSKRIQPSHQIINSQLFQSYYDGNSRSFRRSAKSIRSLRRRQR
jgi:predicted nuclease with TOPRIM domain